MRNLTVNEIEHLELNGCVCKEWDRVLVAEDFDARFVRDVKMSGDITFGSFKRSYELAGGILKRAGVYHATLHNVSVGDDCCIENVKNYIANYTIGDNTFIENVDVILVDGVSSFGNGVEASVLNETGGREVKIYDRLSAQQAYVLALYRARPKAVAAINAMIDKYVEKVSSDRGTIGSNVTIVDTGYLKNVRIGAYAKIEGASKLKNGSVNSCEAAPVHIGVGVIADDFIVSSGSSIEDGVTFSRCFIGQACKLGHTYSASDSLFFSNCQGENGEACAIFAGPFTVTHHKSTLLIAGMFSFMNAGSGSNQSNHMYKLGPIHQGIMERGSKTTSDSYVLWPAKVGTFSLVMGRHTSNLDTSDLPFSYLIENRSTTYIMPGANLKSVGTIRDSKKWPRRDGRTDPDLLDQINYNLLSPYTIQKMLNGCDILRGLVKVSGECAETYSYQKGLIKGSSLRKGISYYELAINKFLGNSLISRIQKADNFSIEEVRRAFVPSAEGGRGAWVDLSGMLAPRDVVVRLLDDIENGKVHSIDELSSRFAKIHSNYYDYEWTWAYDVIEKFYGVNLKTVTSEELIAIIGKWMKSVASLDNLVYEDARKEFSLSAMTSFGADGDEADKDADFREVRGGEFDTNPVVVETLDHIRRKAELGNSIISELRK